ncbi:Farnesyl pyrophosphate synthase [Dirofilaria immitis]
MFEGFWAITNKKRDKMNTRSVRAQWTRWNSRDAMAAGSDEGKKSAGVLRVVGQLAEDRSSEFSGMLSAIWNW